MGQRGTDPSGISVPRTKVLIAEDFPAYRALILDLLKQRDDLWVICDVADGLLAVEKAQELKPDLLVLDIGLPRLNGIECARRIREILPAVKILFLSQEISPGIISEALDLGSCGYVVKSRAAGELLAAICAVLKGERYVSEGFI